MTRRCIRCRLEYDSNGRNTESETVGCDEYDPRDGRCADCWLEMLYDIFGGMLDPCFDAQEKL